MNDEKDNEEPWREDRQRHQTCRATRKHHSYEEKIRIVLDGLRGEDKEQEFLRFGRSGACLDSKQTLGQSPPISPAFKRVLQYRSLTLGQLNQIEFSDSMFRLFLRSAVSRHIGNWGSRIKGNCCSLADDVRIGKSRGDKPQSKNQRNWQRRVSIGYQIYGSTN